MVKNFKYELNDCIHAISEFKSIDDIKRDTVFNNIKIGQWIANRKNDYNLGRLKEETVNALEGIKGWDWSDKKRNRAGNFKNDTQIIQIIKEFVKLNGRIPPFGYETQGFKVGRFIARKREQFKGNKLNNEMIKNMEAIKGWTWVGKAGKGAAPKGYYEPIDLKKFYHYLNLLIEKKGHTQVSVKYKIDDYPLGYFIYQIKTSHKNESPKPLGKKLETILTAMNGWEWEKKSTKKTSPKEIKIILNNYFQEKGHLNPITNEIFDDFRIDNYIYTLRKRHHNNELTSKKINELENVEGWRWELDYKTTPLENDRDSLVRALDLNLQGKSPKEISEIMFISLANVYLLFRKLEDDGHYISRGRDTSNYRLDQSEVNYRIGVIKKMEKENKSTKEIATYLGFTEPYIAQMKRRYIKDD